MGYGEVFHFHPEEGIGIVTFDVPGEPMNTWTQEAIQEFTALLGDLETATDVEGVVFISGKPGNFHAGANLNLLKEMGDREKTLRAMEVFQEMFQRLSALPFPTVAAIHGPCLGGGYEFALACTARIAVDSKQTRIGLPECTLGIFPGAGGTQRLPRLIGYPAVELILRGTMLSASKALEVGLIDKVIGEEGELLPEAKSFLKGISDGSVKLNRKEQDFSQIDAVAETARQQVLKATRGREIPGLMLAIDTIREGVKVPLEKGLQMETRNFVKAVLTKEAKGSIHTFFLKTMSDKPQNMMTQGFQSKPIQGIGVLGFGTMGRGIIIDILRHTKIPVIVKDAQEALEPGKSFVRKILEDLAEKRKLKGEVEELMGRLSTTTTYGDEFRAADLVVEAVFEDVKVKAEVYQELSKQVRPECIVATNTSSIPLSAMAPHVSHPERFGGAHFFSPVWRMELVEIIEGSNTDRETVDNLLGFAAMIRKRPIVCRDHPGFVVNAVLFPYFLRSLDFLEKGNTVEKIDEAFISFGMPVGPIRLIDEVGVDISYYVVKGKGLEQKTLKNLVSAGHIGLKKSGKGIFLKDGSVDPKAASMIAKKEPEELTAEEMQEQVLKEMVQVGKDLLDQNVVTDPRMIDIGMIWGTGFPPEKGGPMKWADLTGMSENLFGSPFYP
jgi:3-hydroxyacyl-CoA dehydrogenase/enoyl-CoA hydratase/carnithine racemase